MRAVCIDMKFSQLQAVVRNKRKQIVEYTIRILKLVSKLESTELVVSKVERKRMLLRGKAEDFDVTVESIMSCKHIYSEDVSRLIVRESSLGKYECDASPQFLVTMTSPLRQPQECMYCGKLGYKAC